MIFAPTEHRITAQGNALGKIAHVSFALKGQCKKCRLRCPFRAELSQSLARSDLFIFVRLYKLFIYDSISSDLRNTTLLIFPIEAISLSDYIDCLDKRGKKTLLST